MNNIYKGPILKLVAKVIVTAALYGAASGLSRRLWRQEMRPREFQLLMIFQQLGLVDTFNVIKLCVNGGSQYLGVILSSAAGNTTQLDVKTVLEPILGFSTSYQFIMAAANAVERRQRIATLASFLSASAGALTTDPTTNAAMGAAVTSKIAYMKAILATRGGN